MVRCNSWHPPRNTNKTTPPIFQSLLFNSQICNVQSILMLQLPMQTLHRWSFIVSAPFSPLHQGFRWNFLPPSDLYSGPMNLESLVLLSSVLLSSVLLSSGLLSSGLLGASASVLLCSGLLGAWASVLLCSGLLGHCGPELLASWALCS